MAPRHQQKAKSGGTDATKASGKEELVQARAVKRAERVELRRVQAEERKEAVCPHYFFVPPTQSGVLPPNDKESHDHVLGKRSLPCWRLSQSH